LYKSYEGGFFMQIEIQSNDVNPIKRMRSYLEMTQEQFSDAYGIPVRTLQQWEAGRRNPPEYVVNLLERAVKEDGKGKNT
jgi:putative transcriptional regulator